MSETPVDSPAAVPVIIGRVPKAAAPQFRFDLGPADVAALLPGEPAYRSRQIWEGLYDQGRELDELTNLSKSLRAKLADEPKLATALSCVHESADEGATTVKWLWRLHGGAEIETVLMHYEDRSTVCISSQAGCAMACGFCATGQGGFERHLSVGEIVEQVVRARRRAADDGKRLSNVVFMGMGEPMANYNAVWGAVERLHADLGLSARHLTISTVGLIPGIKRLTDEDLPVNLAVSLHAANDELRNELVPINRTYPLDALADACADYVDATGRRLSFEWALIAGTNDRPSDAAELAEYALALRAHVNLIPLNPTPGYPTVGTSREGVIAFRNALTKRGVNATIRQNRGTGIDAACGQLRASHGSPGT